MWRWFQGRQFCGWHGRTDPKGLALVAGIVKWADPCVEVVEGYRAAGVRRCDEYDFVRGCVVFNMSPEHVTRVKA